MTPPALRSIPLRDFAARVAHLRFGVPLVALVTGSIIVGRSSLVGFSALPRDGVVWTGVAAGVGVAWLFWYASRRANARYRALLALQPVELREPPAVSGSVIGTGVPEGFRPHGYHAEPRFLALGDAVAGLYDGVPHRRSTMDQDDIASWHLVLKIRDSDRGWGRLLWRAPPDTFNVRHISIAFGMCVALIIGACVWLAPLLLRDSMLWTGLLTPALIVACALFVLAYFKPALSLQRAVESVSDPSIERFAEALGDLPFNVTLRRARYENDHLFLVLRFDERELQKEWMSELELAFAQGGSAFVLNSVHRLLPLVKAELARQYA